MTKINTLVGNLFNSGVASSPLYLRSTVTPGIFWEFPDGWTHMDDEKLPPENMVSANLAETAGGQTSVAITSAWALKGSVSPAELLTGWKDTLPPAARSISSQQEGPTHLSNGARLWSRNTYSVEGLHLVGESWFDILIPSQNDLPADGVLVQRVFNSPVDGPEPQITDLPDEVVRVLCSRPGGQ
ncbi:LpqN/LpqT family lipoprotein [Corynebacterium sp.]|uniref:LpqN/LpqT family lipoprotein n=1 Tax=Corynebacterium sp. TaxID=1720 RepID=UPI00341875DF